MMNRKSFGFGLVVVLALAWGGGFRLLFADEGHGDGSGLPNCPVMDEPIDFTVSSVTDEGPVFYCCAGCIDKYEANPDKYAAKVAVQRELLKDRPKVQVTCPVSGKPVDGKTSITLDGETVGFCCPKCPDAFTKDPAKYKSKLANSFTYQTLCPVSGEAIDPATATTLATGQTLYFCCSKCGPKLVADPASYVSKLGTMGIHLDPKKLTKSQG